MSQKSSNLQVTHSVPWVLNPDTDVLRQTEDKSRTEAEGMIRLADQGPIADAAVEAVEKLPDHKRRGNKPQHKR